MDGKFSDSKRLEELLNVFKRKKDKSSFDQIIAFLKSTSSSERDSWKEMVVKLRGKDPQLTEQLCEMRRSQLPQTPKYSFRNLPASAQLVHADGKSVIGL